MKERPILFSAPMVRAILEGRKTQTRRIIEPQPEEIEGLKIEAGQFSHYEKSCLCIGRVITSTRCRFGKTGDRLWVRETFWQYGKWVKNGLTKTGKQQWKFRASGKKVSLESQTKIPRQKEGFHKRPSIFMPRWASRITLEVIDIRVEQLQDISEDDALAEGIFTCEIGDGYPDLYAPAEVSWSDVIEGQVECAASAAGAYQILWDTINGGGSWDKNPWVWVVEFKWCVAHLDAEAA